MEESAPAWLPIVFLAIPVFIVGGVFMAFAGTRRRCKADRRQQRRGRKIAEVEFGSASAFDDPTDLTPDALIKALGLRDDDHSDFRDLQSRVSYASEVLEPNLYWGSRAGREVFIRIGPDEEIENGTTMGTNRHVRQITVLRVAAPQFTLEDWLVFESGETPELAGVLASVDRHSSVWDGFYAVGGPDGIVLARSAVTGPDYWAYDLWLAERIADKLKLPALEPQQIGPSWIVPYELGWRLAL
jgi:hypothetical protein